MLNQIVLVGRLVKDPEVRDVNDDKKVSNLTLAVPRSFKNENGEYDTDFVDCTLWNAIASNTAEFCKKGDLVGVKGRIQTRVDEETKKSKLDIVVEKITFLTNRSQEKQQEEMAR